MFDESFIRPDFEDIKKAWEKGKTKWLGLFLEEHIISSGESHWSVPENVERQIRQHAQEFNDTDDLSYHRERYYELACDWCRYVSFKEWDDVIHGHDQLSSDSDHESEKNF